MSKIHALLKDWDKYRGSQWAEDAIVNPWNAALEAMKRAKSAMRQMDNFKPYPHCANPFEEIVLVLGRVIARMEEKDQVSPSRDEEYDADVFDEEFDSGPEYGGWY